MIIPVLAAVVPALLLMAYWSIRDHYKPLREAIWVSFGLGLVVVIPVVALVAIYSPQIEQIGDVRLLSVVKAFFAAALPEETAKFLIVFYFSLRHEDLTRPIDAIILAVAVSLGFAAIENTFYVVQSASNWGTTAVVRAFTAVPMHAAAGVMMGYFAAQKLAHAERYQRYVVLMLLVPIFMHGIYDYPALLAERTCNDHAEMADAKECGNSWLLIGVIVLLSGILAMITIRKCPGPRVAGEAPVHDSPFDEPQTHSEKNEREPNEPKYSGLGIASFAISIIAGVLIFVTFVIAVVMEASTPGGMDEESVEFIWIGIAGIGLLIVELVALGLGIGGLFQKEKRKILAILGTVFSGGAVVLLVLAVAVGNAME